MKAVRESPEKLITAGPLLAEKTLPLVVQPAMDGLNLVAWTMGNREFLETCLLKHGAVLFRGFNIRSVTEFEQLIRAISGELLEYTYRSTPRSQVSGKIYTSTEYPADQSIPLHNEMSYSRNWPMNIWFFCVKAPEKGGETPIADTRKVFKRIDPEIRERFMQKKVLYIRNYGSGMDLSWQNVFQTADRTEVEKLCRSLSMEYEWKTRDVLRTRQVCQAVATHPKTGQMLWFNQAHLFHVSSLKPEVRKALLSIFAQEDLPRNSYYGDGSPIENSVLEKIRAAYQQESIIFSWRDGDILMLDNMLTAHGRNPFVGQRKVVVGMAEVCDSKHYQPRGKTR